MSGSHRYLDVLASFHEMLDAYPTQAEMTSIHIATGPARHVTVTVHLEEAEPAVLAAGLVDWKRILVDVEAWAWRTPNGEDVHIAVTGFGTECDETPVVVVAGPIPYGGYLDCYLEPDTAERLDFDTLYTWLGTEIIRAWPFTRAEPVTPSCPPSPPVGTHHPHTESHP